jgi:rieske iron-sulfur protein
MVEDSKENQPSQQKPSEEEKKPVPPMAPPARPAPAAQAATPPPRPAPVPPRPAAPAQPSPQPAPPKGKERRSFLKALFAVGAILSIIPFVPWGTFLSSSIETGTAATYLLSKVRVDQNTKYGTASGALVNVNDLTTFPPNDHWVVTFPSSGDPTLDSQNPDTFLKYELIRLPSELGGNGKKATDFVAFSKVCVHLWCSPNYNPTQTKNPNENGYQAPSATVTTHQQYECPCHGSIYEIPDGKAVAGPASLQAFPSDAIPMLTLQADTSGQLWIVYPGRDPRLSWPNDGVDPIESNGELGYGRDFASYESFIKPVGQVPADLKGTTEQITA